MYKLFSFSLLLICSALLYGQPSGNNILKDGQLLYRIEKASLYGTDEFLSTYPQLRDSIGGCLSYEGENHQIINIILSRRNPFKILARMEFDNLPKIKPISINVNNHEPTQKERDLITIRQDALEKIISNPDNFFTFYENTSFNLIPLITSERKVYILTTSKKSGVVTLGNDYLLKYNFNNKFISKWKLHNSIIELPAKNDTTTISATVHSHVLSDLIEPTDICTLLLNKDLVDWKQHYVISEKYVSVFDLEKQKLNIYMKEAWYRAEKSRNR